MNEIRKVVGGNLILILGFNILFRVSSYIKHQDGGEAILFGMAGTILLLLLVNLILGISYSFAKESKLAKAHFVSMGVVLVIGFSTCWANASL